MRRKRQQLSEEDSAENRRLAVDREWKPLCMLKLTIGHMSGKETVELVKKRTGGKKA